MKKKGKELLTAVGLAALVFLVFSPALGYGSLFDWDDGGFIFANPKMAVTWENIKLYLLNPWNDLYTPLPMLSFMADKALFGNTPFLFHLHNLLLQSAAAVALFLLIRRLGVRTGLAFAAALLWAIHPQRNESVVWIVERKDLHAGLFAFLAVWAYLKAESRKKISYAAAVFSLLAVGGKPASVCVPGVILVLAFCRSRNIAELKDRLSRALVPALAGIAGAIWSLYMSSRTIPGTVEKNFAVVLHNFFWYPLTALVPFERNPIYPPVTGIGEHIPVIAGSVLLFSLMVWSAVKSGISWKKIAASFLIVSGCMVPVLGVLQYTDFHYCDRYNYIVSASVWAVTALLIQRIFRKYPFLTRKIFVSGILFVAVYLLFTELDMPAWRNCRELALSVLRRPGRVNISAYKIAVYDAVRHDDAALLLEAAAGMEKNLPFLTGDFPEDVLYCGVLFMRGHAGIIQGDLASARKNYQLFRQISEKTEKKNTLLWGNASNVFYHDLAILRMTEGDKKGALLYLNQEFAVLKKKGDTSLRYWNAVAMKAGLEQNIPVLLHAWDEIVKRSPGSTVKAEYRKKLYRIYRNSEAPDLP